MARIAVPAIQVIATTQHKLLTASWPSNAAITAVHLETRALAHLQTELEAWGVATTPQQVALTGHNMLEAVIGFNTSAGNLWSALGEPLIG